MKILIIDDDKMICFALKTILESEDDMEVVGIGHSYEDAINLFELNKPDICLFDIRIGEKTGLDAFITIKKSHSDAKIIFLTTFLDDEYIKVAISEGSCGYLLKDDFESICPSIRAVYSGQTVFGSRVINNLSSIQNFNQYKNDEDKLKNLSDREIDILRLVSDGLNNREISSKLFLSEGTVRNYISNMLEKLELRDRTQLAIYYLKEK